MKFYPTQLTQFSFLYHKTKFSPPPQIIDMYHFECKARANIHKLSISATVHRNINLDNKDLLCTLTCVGGVGVLEVK